MSLEKNRMHRLHEAHLAMMRLHLREDFAGPEIEAYRRELIESLRTLDAGLAEDEIAALEAKYAPIFRTPHPRGTP